MYSKIFKVKIFYKMLTLNSSVITIGTHIKMHQCSLLFQAWFREWDFSHTNPLTQYISTYVLCLEEPISMECILRKVSQGTLFESQKN
jgi:hypothetical protein